MSDTAWRQEVSETRGYWRFKRKRRAQARALARKGNAWSVTARLYMAGCARYGAAVAERNDEPLLDLLNSLYRRMELTELNRVEAELTRRMATA